MRTACQGAQPSTRLRAFSRYPLKTPNFFCTSASVQTTFGKDNSDARGLCRKDCFRPIERTYSAKIPHWTSRSNGNLSLQRISSLVIISHLFIFFNWDIYRTFYHFAPICCIYCIKNDIFIRQKQRKTRSKPRFFKNFRKFLRFF